MPVRPEDIPLYAKAEDVDPRLWDRLAGLDLDRAALRAGAIWTEAAYRLEMLGREYEIDPDRRRIERSDGGEVNFQEALVLLVYLTGRGPGGLGGRRVSFKALKGGDMFFTAAHTLATEELAQRLDLDAARFAELGRRLGAEPTDKGEGSWLIWALPQIPMEAFFFGGDDEFPPRINLLVDSAADRYLDLGVLWGLVNLLADRMTELDRD